ncbi:AraC family transcriptional regulator [Pedobacter sp.]|uniref:AraC family transcriptional regulator n=1 Tax=Pedobacter sp. TaxID=1411316 RepID=UPI003D7FD7CF
MNNKLHYHAEVELIYFNQGSGAQFIGDSISAFSPGDLLLVGANLPHYWRFEGELSKSRSEHHADVRVAHFTENFFGEYFLNLPENRRLKAVLQQANRGIRIRGKSASKVAGFLEEMLQAEGTDKLILLMQSLLEIAKCKDLELLSSLGYGQVQEKNCDERIRDVYAYTYANFKKKISLEEIAAIARISPTSFCRYFKSLTHKTYSQFLTEIKVGKACKLLVDNALDIKQVCYESGFHNFASFHKAFKEITGKSPLNYQKHFLVLR